jgi:uncharacterized protein YneF (UPF0154 family)
VTFENKARKAARKLLKEHPNATPETITAFAYLVGFKEAENLFRRITKEIYDKVRKKP